MEHIRPVSFQCENRRSEKSDESNCRVWAPWHKDGCLSIFYRCCGPGNIKGSAFDSFLLIKVVNLLLDLDRNLRLDKLAESIV